MAHLVMIESWTLSSGLLLPPVIVAAGHRYTLVCSDPARYGPSAVLPGTHPVIRQARRVLKADTNDVAATIAALEQVNAEDPFDGVITCCDYYLGVVARVAEHFGLPGPSAATIAVANSKHLMREALRRAGMPGPASAVADGWDELRAAAAKIGFPLIVKPVDLCASQLVSLVADEAELRRACEAIQAMTHNARGQARLPLILLESVLDGPEFSVETVTCGGRTTVVGVTDKSLTGFPHFVESGHMFPAQLPDQQAQAIGRCAVEALAAVGYDQGVAHVEVKWTTEGPRIVEINTRVGGNWIATLVRRVSGHDLLDAMVACALGQAWPASALQPSRGVGSAAVLFVTAPADGRVEAIGGWDGLTAHPAVIEHALRPDLVGRTVRRPRHNDDYLGYFICANEGGEDARRVGERLLAGVKLRVTAAEAARLPA
jgi:biotin carboxylase